jgi:hypothetical protein
MGGVSTGAKVPVFSMQDRGHESQNLGCELRLDACELLSIAAPHRI